jgi:hypothetical protein
MFRLLKLRPPNGWNAVGWELGIVTLGVLLALGAQELVQSLHWQREVRETRKALDAEVARDLAAYEYRVSQRECVEDRLGELGKWAASLRSEKPLTLRKDIRPTVGFAIRTAAWEVTDGEIAARIPIEAKMGYAGMYDAMRAFDELTDAEEQQWIKLVELQSSPKLEENDVRTIEQAIRLIGTANVAVRAFRKNIHRFAGELGVNPEANIEGTADPIIAQWRKELCISLL